MKTPKQKKSNILNETDGQKLKELLAVLPIR
jgi:hypothetical protein